MSENFTICGGCNLRVPCIGYEPEPHNCVVISELTRKMNASLIDIQKIFDKKFEQQAANFMMYRNNIKIKISEVEKQLSSCIDVGLLYSDRQVRETWQAGCDVAISTLMKKIEALDYMFKEHLICVDNSQAEENAKCLGLTPISELSAGISKELKGKDSIIVFFEENYLMPEDAYDRIIPKVESKRKLWVNADTYFEESNKRDARIVELENHLGMRKNEYQAALNEANKLREHLNSSHKENEKLVMDIQVLNHAFEYFKNELSEKTKRIEELEKIRAIREGHRPFNGSCIL